MVCLILGKNSHSLVCKPTARKIHHLTTGVCVETTTQCCMLPEVVGGASKVCLWRGSGTDMCFACGCIFTQAARIEAFVKHWIVMHQWERKSVRLVAAIQIQVLRHAQSPVHPSSPPSQKLAPCHSFRLYRVAMLPASATVVWQQQELQLRGAFNASIGATVPTSPCWSGTGPSTKSAASLPFPGSS